MDDVRLDLLTEAIKASDLDGASKDLLADQLHYAASINGSTDPVLIGMKRMAILGVRRELSTYAQIKSSIKGHETAYHLAGLNGTGTVPKSWREIGMYLASNYPMITLLVIGAVVFKWGPCLIAAFAKLKGA